MSFKIHLICLAAAIATGNAMAQAPIDVSYTVSGTKFDWTLDFTVTNNVLPGPQDMQLYFFAVEMPTRDIVGSPTGWDPDYLVSYGPGEYTNYSFNNIWENFPNSGITPGLSVSGFKVHSNQEYLPSVIPWNAFTYTKSNEFYTGDAPYQHSPWNPLFEGTVAGPSAVPEVQTCILAACGLAALCLLRRKAGA